MEPPSAGASVVCSLCGQGIRVRQLAAVVVCSIASATGELPATRAGPTAGRRPVSTPNALTCVHCGDVIGVYEPLLLIGDGEIRETSLAAERDVLLARAAHYHRACYAAREQDASAGQ
jgi:hypothetical protein